LIVPADLQAALRLEPEANRAFDALSFSHKREYVNWIVEAKRSEHARSASSVWLMRCAVGSSCVKGLLCGELSQPLDHIAKHPHGNRVLLLDVGSSGRWR
jgi:hypothetical protein